MEQKLEEDRYVLLTFIADKELIENCNKNDYFRNKVCDESFFHSVLDRRYPELLDFKKHDQTYKAFYLEMIYYLSSLKEIYKYDYIFGKYKYVSNNPKDQYNYFKKNLSMNELMYEGALSGEIDQVEFALKNGSNIHYENDAALNAAIIKGYLNIVKYLVNNGANIHNKSSLISAVEKNQLEVIKYLLSLGMNFEEIRSAEFYAKQKGHLELVEYLKNYKMNNF